jgi:hypothetical protein
MLKLLGSHRKDVRMYKTAYLFQSLHWIEMMQLSCLHSSKMQTITQMKNSAWFAEHTYTSKLINLAMKVAVALNPKQPPCDLMLNNGGGGAWKSFPGTIVWLPQDKHRLTKTIMKKHHHSPKHHASEKLLTRTQTDARKSCMSRQKASDIQLVSWSHQCSYFQTTGYRDLKWERTRNTPPSSTSE